MHISISKDDVNAMPPLTFPGHIHVIDSVLNLIAAVNFLKKSPVVGFDTETRPSFHRGESHKVALIQLSTLEDCFLFRVNKIGLPQRLIEYLADASCLKVGLSLHDDFSMLRRLNPNLKLEGFVDIQNIVGKYHITDISLQKVYAILFQKKISKGQRLTNWEAPQLTPGQQNYASIDAWSCIHIYNYLNGGHFVPEKSQFIVEDEE